ncbi:MAG: hypothetical protein HY690_10020 [Chloroflexi bacterium]|nr:hypothetical protein [Chloroflexota bacterium]
MLPRSPTRLRGGILPGLAFLLLVSALVTTPAAAAEQRFRRAGSPFALDLVRWELTHLVSRADRLVQAFWPGQVRLRQDDLQLASTYFTGVEAEARGTLRRSLEAVLERGLAAVLQHQHLAALVPLQPPTLVFPPVSLAISQPPKLLVISPRARIEVARSLLLEPSLEWPQAEQIEEQVDDADRVSLIVPVGGLSTYPAMVLDSSDAASLLAAAAHEWVHAYLFFTPLGQRYWSDYQARTINEMVAELVGRDLGEQLARELGLPGPRREPPPPGRQTGFSLQAQMRATRVELERLLAGGQLAAAEAYLHQRREFFAAHGYPIRKLNQAYFAFHGSYAEGGAAGANPIATHLQRLRQRSESLGQFLQRVSQVTTLDELTAAAEQ